MSYEPIFEIKESEKKENYAKFIFSPLEQGYGNTLGNSLRRVLLTSLPGAVITEVKISGVPLSSSEVYIATSSYAPAGHNLGLYHLISRPRDWIWRVRSICLITMR